MKIEKYGSNHVVISLTDTIEVLFSYKTPVAGFKSGMGYFKTDTFYSVTTSRHINHYLPYRDVAIVTQNWINNLIMTVGDYDD